MRLSVCAVWSLFLLFLNAHAQPVHVIGFEENELGEFNHQDWLDGGYDVPWVNGFDQQRATIDNEFAKKGTQSLKIFYPKGAYGTDGSGAQAPIQLPAEDEYYISYYVRFSESFSWGGSSEGGKLPGLAGSGRCGGCSTCNGTNGFTTRLMWRPQGKGVLYLYHMDKTQNCGDNIDLMKDNAVFHFQKGEWHKITQRVKINTGNNKDGEVEMWVDGKAALNLDGLQFVNNGDQVDIFYFSTFHGGSNSNWAPLEDSYAWFDEIIISTHKEDVMEDLCAAPSLGNNKSLCGAENGVTLNSNLSSENRSFTWYLNNVEISENTSAITVNAPGTYRLVVDSAGCITSDEVEVLDEINFSLGADQELCSPSVIELTPSISNANFSYIWKKNNTIINENQDFLKVYNPGTYSLSIQSDDCASGSDEVNISSKLINVQGDTLCGTGTANLSVLDEGTFKWYNNLNDATSIHEGNQLSTQIQESEIYYVEDADGFEAAFGREAPELGNSNYTWGHNQFDRKLKFEVIREGLTLDSVTVYPESTQDVNIRLLMADNATVIEEKTFSALESGAQRVFLDFEIPPGQYFIDCEGSTGDLMISNDNDPNTNYPYVIENVINMTAHPQWVANSPWYMFLYDWKISGGNSCDRTAVAAVIDEEGEDCITHASAIHQNKFKIFPNPNKGKIFIQTENAQNNVNAKVYNLEGKLMLEKTFQHSPFTLDLNGYQKGIYLIELSHNKHVEQHKIILN